MARTTFRDVGGGRRRGYARLMTSAFCLLLISTMSLGCGLDNPTSPNEASDLTGQTTNQIFSFSGTIGVSSVSGSVIANDQSTVTIVVVVRDSSGNAIPNLTSVTLSTDLGGFVIGVDAEGNNIATASTSVVTFNGQADAQFQSLGGAVGTATIVASIGTTRATTSVDIDPAPLSGTLSMAFGSTGTGTAFLSKVATEAAPLDESVGVTALDNNGDPLSGALVEFVIVSDSTDEQTANEPAIWLASRQTNTGGSGDAINILRVVGPGVVVAEARMIDVNTGQTVAVSNRIILTTSTTFVATLSFADGTASFRHDRAVHHHQRHHGPRRQLVECGVGDECGRSGHNLDHGSRQCCRRRQYGLDPGGGG